MSDMMKCHNCGAPLRPTAKICVSCGTLVATAAAEEIKEVSTAEATQPLQEIPADNTMIEPDEPAPAAAPEPKAGVEPAQPAATPAYESAPDGIYMKQSASASAEPAMGTTSAASPGRKPLWLGAFALLLVAIIAAGIWQNGSDSPAETAGSDTATEQEDVTATASQSGQIAQSEPPAGQVAEPAAPSAEADSTIVQEPSADVIRDVTNRSPATDPAVAAAEAEAAKEAAEAAARARHEEKLLALRQQQEAQERRAEELRKAREDMEAAKRQRELEQERQAAALKEAQAREQAQNNTATAKQSGEDTASASPASGGAYKEKFRGAFGMVVAKRAYPTKDMANRAQEMWRRERKILEPDGSITVMQEESKEPSVIPGQ